MYVRQSFRKRDRDNQSLTERIDACTQCTGASTSPLKLIASHTEILLRLHYAGRQWEEIRAAQSVQTLPTR